MDSCPRHYICLSKVHTHKIRHSSTLAFVKSQHTKFSTLQQWILAKSILTKFGTLRHQYGQSTARFQHLIFCKSDLHALLSIRYLEDSTFVRLLRHWILSKVNTHGIRYSKTQRNVRKTLPLLLVGIFTLNLFCYLWLTLTFSMLFLRAEETRENWELARTIWSM